jgi:predicted amidohydrolase
MKIALVQMPVTASKQENLQTARAYLARAADAGADLAVLPEMFCCPYSNESFVTHAEEKGGEVWTAMSRAAAEFGLWLVAGSMPEREGERLYNTAFVFDPAGNQIACHRKAHLFDIDIEGGQRFKESDTFTAGDAVTVFDTPFGRLGLCICFDMRFPELSLAMAKAGAQAILAPAAFNMTTGPAHWELLFRQRAVDNQLFTVGVAPARDPSASYVSYGNSMVCSPWGTVLCRADGDPALLLTDLDFAQNAAIRSQLPLLSARRPELYTTPL